MTISDPPSEGYLTLCGMIWTESATCELIFFGLMRTKNVTPRTSGQHLVALILRSDHALCATSVAGMESDWAVR
jgi:hypothetical protein